ncbi:ribosomal protein s6 modification protein [Holotrichia oblita]|nr:ribosomal protein s6 modification protein [Holotrichia oblita]
MKICFVRHGETDWVKEGRLQGREDIPLNEVGKKQIAENTLYLQKFDWHAIITSPLIRAKASAQILAEYLGIAQVHEDIRFIERDYGEASGLTEAERFAKYPDRNYPQMENKDVLQKRVIDGLTDYSKKFERKNIIIVAHGGVINSILAFLSNSEIGTDYIKSRLSEELYRRGIDICYPNNYASYQCEKALDFDFAVFFDKDIPLAKFYERNGIRVFNSAKTVELCDDKETTYSHFISCGKNHTALLPKTIAAPLMYDVNDNIDKDFLDFVSQSLGYPIVVKENTGSQGRQVYLATNQSELVQLYKKLKRIPHIYQEYVGDVQGDDIRIYIVGKKVIGAAQRTNTTDFRSNVTLGGQLELIRPDSALEAYAISIAQALSLEYGSVDFIKSKDSYYFIEANSSVYMKNAESKGLDIAGKFADYILNIMFIDNNIKVLKNNIEHSCVECGRDTKDIKIVAATKTVQPDKIDLLSSYGITTAGENRTSELLEKYGKTDTEWHFIGHLQTNKVKSIIDKVTLIHSLDRTSLADEINRCAKAKGIVSDTLIEVNIGAEQSKSGVAKEGIDELYSYIKTKPNIRVRGFMAVMPKDADEKYTKRCKRFFINTKR